MAAPLPDARSVTLTIGSPASSVSFNSAGDSFESLRFCSREVALLCGLRGSELALRASFFQLYHQRAGTIERMLLIGHEDVLIFRRDAR